MAHKEQITKTNAARLLDELGISYSIHESEVDLSDLSAVSMAKKSAPIPCAFSNPRGPRGQNRRHHGLPAGERGT